MMKQFFFLMGLLLLMLVAHPSWAVFGAGCQCGAISSYHSKTRNHVSQETTHAAHEIINALRAHSAQQSRYLDRQVEAHKRIADAQQHIHSVRLRKQFRAEAESGRYDPNPDFCHLVDLSAQVLPTKTISANQIIDHATNNWSLGTNEIVQKNGIRMAAWLHREKQAIGSINNIDNPTIDWGLITDHSTISLSESYLPEAIARLASNTVDPIPPIPITNQALKTPQGLSEAAIRDSIHARKKAAMKAIEYAIELHMPVESGGVYTTLAKLSNYNEEVPEQISQIQVMDIRSMLYYSPTLDSLANRQQKNETALLQDLIDLNSLNTRINFIRLEQEARNSVVLASILAAMTDNGYTNLIPN